MPPVRDRVKASVKKLLLQHLIHIYQGIQNWYSKQEMELFKQEMELFHPLPDLWSKNFFYKMSLIFTKELIIDFQNRKWNYPHRKWNYFSNVKMFLIWSKELNFIFKTENGIIQTGNGMISLTSRPLIKKLLFQHHSHMIQGVQN